MARKYTSVRGYITTEPKMIYDRLSRKNALFFCVGYITERDNIKYQNRAKIVIKNSELIETLKPHFAKGCILRLKGYEQYIKLYKGSKRFKVINARIVEVLYTNYFIKYFTRQQIEAFNTFYNPSKQDKEYIREIAKEINFKPSFRKRVKASEKAKNLITEMKLCKSMAISDYKEGNKNLAFSKLNYIRYIYFYALPSHYKKDIQNKYAYLIQNDLKEKANLC